MAQIQENIKRKRNPISRYFHTKKDNEAVYIWRLELYRILGVFNVCSITSAWPPLTLRSQTEFEKNAHVIVPGIPQDVSKVQTMVSNIRHTLRRQETADLLPPRSVSVTRAAHRIHTYCRPDSKQVSDFDSQQI